MFDLDGFLGSCHDAKHEAEPRRATRELLTRALARPDDVATVFDPGEGGLNLLYHAPDLTVLNVVWAPGMRLYPHNHRMWAIIGVYAGQEDNTFYRRTSPGGHAITVSGGRELATGDVLVLGDDAIHAVANPKPKLTGAIHIYGGDFVNEPRSQWGPGALEERPYDMDEALAQFAEANRRWREST
jgi:predicted metal-dependent enzyme (double-stranded beta helix superfamily)